MHTLLSFAKFEAPCGAIIDTIASYEFPIKILKGSIHESQRITLVLRISLLRWALLLATPSQSFCMHQSGKVGGWTFYSLMVFSAHIKPTPHAFGNQAEVPSTGLLLRAPTVCYQGFLLGRTKNQEPNLHSSASNAQDGCSVALWIQGFWL